MTFAHQQKRANDGIKSAKRRGVGVAELTAQLFGGRVVQRTWPAGDSSRRLAEISISIPQPPRNAAHCRDENLSSRTNGFDSDEEEGVNVIMGNRYNDRPNPIEECRRMSTSAWLHFPNIELGFLFFAFEGSVASQLSAIRNAKCDWVVYIAVAILVGAAKRSEHRHHTEC